MIVRASLSATTLGGRWLLLARVAWAILAVIILGLDVAGIPYAYAQYMKTCTGPACAESGRLTPEGIQDLQQLGISPQFYAAYIGVGLAITVTLVLPHRREARNYRLVMRPALSDADGIMPMGYDIR
jgi:hypothetical protein